MQVFDASSMIYAWDNYPVDQFPGLWSWMAAQAQAQAIVIPRVAFEEVGYKTPECASWLKNADIHVMAITNAIVQDALRIKNLLGIEHDNYHPKGVDENDLFIIASARQSRRKLVSNEGLQLSAPDIPSKKKIPAVCKLSEVSVPCINFLQCIKSSGVIFR